ncbi:MAG: hypothetical protein RIS21_883 [Planctomycetota bacterium]|jgi:hypothetical protein
MDPRELQSLDVRSDMRRAFNVGPKTGQCWDFERGVARGQEIGDALARTAEDDRQLRCDAWLSVLHETCAAAATVPEKDPIDARRLARRACASLIGDLVADGRADSRLVDRDDAFRRWFDAWMLDDGALVEGMDVLILDAAVAPGDFRTLVGCASEALEQSVIPFPARPGERLDVRRAVLRTERQRVTGMLAEGLAGLGRHDLAIELGIARFESQGVGAPLVRALLRAGRRDEALAHGRRLVESPKTRDVADIRFVLTEVVEAPSADRASKAHLEALFLRSPGRDVFHALKSVVPAEQWDRVRRRILGHIERHRTAPTLLFTLYLDEGLLVEADGVVFTQAVDADALVAAAERLGVEHPTLTAGWLLTAAYRVSDAVADARIAEVVVWLREARNRSGDGPFERALRGFRGRFAENPEILGPLDEAGLR